MVGARWVGKDLNEEVEGVRGRLGRSGGGQGGRGGKTRLERRGARTSMSTPGISWAHTSVYRHTCTYSSLPRHPKAYMDIHKRSRATRAFMNIHEHS